MNFSLSGQDEHTVIKRYAFLITEFAAFNILKEKHEPLTSFVLICSSAEEHPQERNRWIM